MSRFLTNKEKLDLMFQWSRENAEELVNEVFAIWGKNEKPTQDVSYESFCQYLNNIDYAISQKFDEYNKSGKYTNKLSDYDLTEYDKTVFINTLIGSAALIVTGNTFYTN